ncbi:MAG: hypothetical protein WA977_00385 [Halobacteriota archaeon]
MSSSIQSGISNPQRGGWDTYEEYTRMSFAKSEGMVNGDVWIDNLMIQCTSGEIETLCSTSLSYAPTTKLVNDFGTEVKANWIEGTFGCDLAEVRIEPETLNLKSKGVFTAFITLPESYDIADINVSTVECEGASVVNSSIIPGIDTLRVKFDREDLRKDLPAGDAVTMRVTGEMQTGKIFEGRDTIRVIAP